METTTPLSSPAASLKAGRHGEAAVDVDVPTDSSTPVGSYNSAYPLNVSSRSQNKSSTARPVIRAYFPSSESLASSALWSSTENSSEIYSGESQDDSDYTSEYSTDSDDDSIDEEGIRRILISPRRKGFAAQSAAIETAAANLPNSSSPEGLPFGGMEGLPFTLESLKKDLEKVGRVIISSNAGEVAAERAQTLASINWLASHVPNAVLDKLGHEIRDTLGQKDDIDDVSKNVSVGDNSAIGVSKVANIISDDTMSDVSELSNHEDDPSYEGEEAMKIVEPLDVSNVQMSYGDLAIFAHTRPSSFLPDEGADNDDDGFVPCVAQKNSGMSSAFLPDIDEVNPTGLTPLHCGSMNKMGSVLNSLPNKASEDESCVEGAPRQSALATSILDVIPSKRSQDSSNVLAQGARIGSRGSISTVTTASSTTSTKISPKKGVKGFLRRLKRSVGDSVPPLPPPVSPLDIARRKALSTPDSFRCNSSKFDAFSKVGVYKKAGMPATDTSETLERTTDNRSLPYSSTYRCALLFVDISGFTKLSRLLDPESLSRAINAYFQLIVDEVLDGKGDLLKFAGDAVFIEWKATKDSTLETCVESAVTCASKIISRCADFSVLSNGATGNCSYLLTSQAAQVDTLNVHCGVGAGQMVGVHVGDHKSRREYILLGQPISQATTATNFASLGEVAISAEAHSILSRVCRFKGEAAHNDGKTPTIVATRNEFKFTTKKKLGTHANRKIVNDISRGVTSHVEGLEVEALRKYRRMMSLYVHPVVVDNDLAAAHHIKTKKVRKIDRSEQERHREEAEIRNVFTMFVNPGIETKVTSDESANKSMYETLNDIMNLSTREIERFRGHLRQFIVDDKGLVLIITFGLRGTTIPNMVSQRALPACIAIHGSLKVELGIDSRIGATIGEAYCGVVGGVKRHEYAVLGPSVNLAARLMASKMNPGILVDNRVRMMANRSFGFNALPPVVAKGYSEPVPIFEPLSTLERYWGRIISNFVGRKPEIKTLMQNTSEMLRGSSPSRFLLIDSKSGVGKSTMMAHGIEHIRRSFSPRNNRLIVIKNVSKESNSLVPFGVFRSILGRILSSFQKGKSSDERSLRSGASLSTHGLRSIAWESISGRSISQSTNHLNAEESIEVFQILCQELKMTPTFVDYALSELLGVELTQISYPGQSSPPSTQEMVTFLAKAFRLCTRDSKLVVLALDDVHYIDEYSWMVIQRLFTSEENILVVGAVDSSSVEQLKIAPDFWKALESRFHTEKRFARMKLGHLNREDITSMIMKTLGLRRKDIPDDVLDGVTIQSGGMPYFINEILENVKREMAVDEDFELADMTFDSFGDLVLQRLDSFDINTRNVLNIGAVLGLSFTLEDVVAIELRTSDGCEDAVRKMTTEALEVAVEDGILESREMSDEDSDVEDSCRFAFCHGVWRGTLLNLMLEGRKRDLHRVIAETLEESEVETNDYMFQTKLFKHWVHSGNLLKSTELALSVGHHFEERLGLPAQSIRIYTEALDLLRESEDGYSKGFSKDVIAKVSTEHLTCIIQLQVSLAKALAMAQQTKESVSAYQDALKITQIAQCSSQLTDRSILFPVFDGLALAVKNGHIKQDAECRYEKAMLRRYMQETRLHGDPIFVIHALTLQADMYGRLGEYDKAIEVQKALSQVYNAEYYSMDLCEMYGSDIGAQCLANSARWHVQLDMVEEAMSICGHLTGLVLPHIERRNVHASFMALYPILFVLIECGLVKAARESFERFVCEPFTELPQGMSTFFFPLYDPILMLIDLKDNEQLESAVVEDYMEWASDYDNLSFGDPINARTGELGRTADSISSEICYLLAKLTKRPQQKRILLINGRKVAANDLEFVKAHGTTKLARLQSHVIHTNLGALSE